MKLLTNIRDLVNVYINNVKIILIIFLMIIKSEQILIKIYLIFL